MTRASRTDYQREYRRQYRKDSRESIQAMNLKSHHKMTERDLEFLWMMQEGQCAVCKTEIELQGRNRHIDHDHACCPSSMKTCGRCTRGILCRACNHLLGNAKENPEILLSAIIYLKNNLRGGDFFDPAGA